MAAQTGLSNACNGPCCEQTVHAGAADSLSGVMWLFDTSPFPARWYCGEWSPALGWVHISSDLLTWGAYTAIPLVLAFFIRRRPDTPFPAIFWLFAAFIFSCGTVHLVEAIIFYEPIYRFSGVMKAITAGVSWLTVIALIPAMPRALELPGLAQINTQLSAKNSELLRVEQALEQRNNDLQYLLHVISHDLREPARAVTSFSELLHQRFGDQLNDEAIELLQFIDQGGQRLHRQLDDIGDLAKARTGEYDTEAVPLGELVDEVLANVAERVRETDASITVSDALPMVEASRKWTIIALQNLIANALKYTRQGQRPVLEIEPYVPQADEPDQPGVVVRDHGPGVDADQAERIFRLFKRGTSDQDGTGAGLAIVRQIAQRHGGSAWARTNLNEGASFVITFGRKAHDA